MRRTALKKMALGVTCGCWALTSCSHPQRARRDDRAQLQRELEALTRPPYAQAGVLVFLYGENLSSKRNVNSAPPDEGRELAEELRAIGKTYLELKPSADALDVGKLAEVLAVRNFGQSSSKRQL